MIKLNYFLISLLFFGALAHSAQIQIQSYENQNACLELISAVLSKDVKNVIELLGESRAYCQNSEGFTPLHALAYWQEPSNQDKKFFKRDQFRFLHMTALLFQRGFAKINQADLEGITAPMLAASLGNYRFFVGVTGLSFETIDLTLRDNQGQSLLDWAEAGNDQKMIQSVKKMMERAKIPKRSGLNN